MTFLLQQLKNIKIKQLAKQAKLAVMFMDTGEVHFNKEGKPLCKIYRKVEKITKYSGEALRAIRAKQTNEALQANQ